ncbi:hypothetical protein DL771_009733 [Monosporascus sp. 5C6A]|nr:hypothetical protein DL771_009733 [Monosporascus sp. 5C6A]
MYAEIPNLVQGTWNGGDRTPAIVQAVDEEFAVEAPDFRQWPPNGVSASGRSEQPQGGRSGRNGGGGDGGILVL